MEWVDPTTGEELFEWRETNCIPAFGMRPPENYATAPDEYAERRATTEGKRVGLTHERDAYLAQWDRRMKALDQEDKATDYFLLQPAMDQVGFLLEGTKKKSIDVPHGRLSFRKTKAKRVVEDKAAMEAWANEHCPAAVSVSMVTRVSKSALPLEGEIPGTALVEAGESFTWKPAKKKEAK